LLGFWGWHEMITENYTASEEPESFSSMKLRSVVLWYFHGLFAFDAAGSQHQAFGSLTIL